MQSTSKVELGQVFGDIKLNVPKFQRAYSWKEKQVREMFKDITYAMENYRDDSEKYHYFGTIGLEDDDSRRFFTETLILVSLEFLDFCIHLNLRN